MKREKLQEMYSQLDTWIDIGIGDDILNSEMRPEFQPFVKEQKAKGVEVANIPQKVLWALREKLNSLAPASAGPIKNNTEYREVINPIEDNKLIDSDNNREERVLITIGSIKIEVTRC